MIYGANNYYKHTPNWVAKNLFGITNKSSIGIFKVKAIHQKICYTLWAIYAVFTMFVFPITHDDVSCWVGGGVVVFYTLVTVYYGRLFLDGVRVKKFEIMFVDTHSQHYMNQADDMKGTFHVMEYRVDNEYPLLRMSNWSSPFDDFHITRPIDARYVYRFTTKDMTQLEHKAVFIRNYYNKFVGVVRKTKAGNYFVDNIDYETEVTGDFETIPENLEKTTHVHVVPVAAYKNDKLFVLEGGTQKDDVRSQYDVTYVRRQAANGPDSFKLSEIMSDDQWTLIYDSRMLLSLGKKYTLSAEELVDFACIVYNHFACNDRNNYLSFRDYATWRLQEFPMTHHNKLYRGTEFVGKRDQEIAVAHV